MKRTLAVSVFLLSFNLAGPAWAHDWTAVYNLRWTETQNIGYRFMSSFPVDSKRNRVINASDV